MPNSTVDSLYRLPVLGSLRGELQPQEFALLPLPAWQVATLRSAALRDKKLHKKPRVTKIIVVAMPLPNRHDDASGRLVFYGTEALLTEFVALPDGEVYGMTLGVARRRILSLTRAPGRWTALITADLPAAFVTPRERTCDEQNLR